MKQYAKNACGTVAIFHILCNLFKSRPELFEKDSNIGKFYESATTKNSHERGEIFLENKNIKTIHKKHVEGGQSQVTEEVDSHFISFIPKSIVFFI